MFFCTTKLQNFNIFGRKTLKLWHYSFLIFDTVFALMNNILSTSVSKWMELYESFHLNVLVGG